MFSIRSKRWTVVALAGLIGWGVHAPVRGSGAPAPSSGPPVEEARRLYQITVANLARLDERIAALEAQPDGAEDSLAVYRAYRDRLAAEADRQRQALEARGIPPTPVAPSVTGDVDDAARSAPWPVDVRPPIAETESNRLQRELRESLAVFDGVLMRKQDELADQEPSPEVDGGGWSSASAEAQEILRQIEQSQGEGTGQDASSAQGSEGASGAEASEQAAGVGQAGEGTAAEGADGSEGDLGRMADAGRAEDGGAGETGESGEAGMDGASVELPGDLAGAEEGGADRGAGQGLPDRFPGGGEQAGQAGGATGGQEPMEGGRRRAYTDDDDIVARQLREAAERETDPELKEKLWREYEAYKRGARP